MRLSPTLMAAHQGQWPTTWHAFRSRTRAVPPRAWGGATWAQGLLRWGWSRLPRLGLTPDSYPDQAPWCWLPDLIEADAQGPHATETARWLFWCALRLSDHSGPWGEQGRRWMASAEAWLGGPAAVVEQVLHAYAHQNPPQTAVCPVHTPQLAHAMGDYRATDPALWQGCRANGQARLWAWCRLMDTFTRGRHLQDASLDAGCWALSEAAATHAQTLLAHPDPWRDCGAVNLALAHPPTRASATPTWQALALTPAGMSTWDLADPMPTRIHDVYAPLGPALSQAIATLQRADHLVKTPSIPTAHRVRPRA